MKEREEDKRCWICKHTDEEYHCWCDLTGDNIVLDLTVKNTMECENYEAIK